MPRKMRVEYPGAIYHIMSRGTQEGYCVQIEPNHGLTPLRELKNIASSTAC